MLSLLGMLRDRFVVATRTRSDPTIQITHRSAISGMPMAKLPPRAPMIASNSIGTVTTKTVEANLLRTVFLLLGC